MLARGKGGKGQGAIHLAFHLWHRAGCGFYRGPSWWRRDPPASAPVLSVRECGTSQILPLHLWGASHGILPWCVTVVSYSDFCWDNIIAFVEQNLTWLWCFISFFYSCLVMSANILSREFEGCWSIITFLAVASSGFCVMAMSVSLTITAHFTVLLFWGCTWAAGSRGAPCPQLQISGHPALQNAQLSWTSHSGPD